MTKTKTQGHLTKGSNLTRMGSAKKQGASFSIGHKDGQIEIPPSMDLTLADLTFQGS